MAVFVGGAVGAVAGRYVGWARVGQFGVCVVGCGDMGTTHAKAWMRGDVGRVVAAYRALLAGRTSAAEVWRSLRTEGGYGVVRGSLRVVPG